MSEVRQQGATHIHIYEAYRDSALFGLAYLIDILLYVAVMLFVARYFDPFQGIGSNEVSHVVRIALYSLSFSQIFFIKILANKPFKNRDKIGLEERIVQLKKSALIIYGLCDGVALFGLIMFILYGAGPDFFIFLFLSIFYLIIYFPRFDEWETWAFNTDRPKE